MYGDDELYRQSLLKIDLEKLDLLGTDYILENYLSFAEEKAYRNYIADSIAITAEIIAKIGGGKIEMPRYSELSKRADSTSEQPKKQLSADEIINQVNQKHGLKMIE